MGVIRALAARWPGIAAVALAAVLAHSALGHFRDDPALREHYRAALGTAAATPWIGLLQCVAAAALCLPRTRIGAAWSIVAIVAAATLWRVMRNSSADSVVPALVVIAAAMAIGVGEAARERIAALR